MAAESEQVRSAIAEARSGLDLREASLATAGAEEAEHRESLTAARVRIEALEDLKSAMEGLEEGVKKILAESKSVGVRGVVSESLIVEPGYLDAVEALLGSLLGAAVVDSEAQAKRALALVGGPSAGHAYVTVLERGRGRHALRPVDPRKPGIVGWVREGARGLVKLGFALQDRKPLVPEALEEGHQLLESLGPRPIEAPGSRSTLVHQAGVLKDVQVLGDRGPGHIELRCDLSGRELVRTDEREDLASPRLGDRP